MSRQFPKLREGPFLGARRCRRPPGGEAENLRPLRLENTVIGGAGDTLRSQTGPGGRAARGLPRAASLRWVGRVVPNPIRERTTGVHPAWRWRRVRASCRPHRRAARLRARTGPLWDGVQEVAPPSDAARRAFRTAQAVHSHIHRPQITRRGGRLVRSGPADLTS